MRLSTLHGISLLLLASMLFVAGCLETVQGDLKKEWGLRAYYDKDDKQEAFSLFQEAAQKGDSEAQYLLGFMLLTGDGVPQDTEAGLRWIHKAADQKFAAAENKLGFLYLSGLHGVAQDLDKSIPYLTRAADQGEVNAMLALGMVYATQPGMQDFDRAASWYAKAREAGADIPVDVTNAGTLKEAVGNPRTAAPPAQASRQMVMDAQKLLKILGYDPGVADGIPGKRTAEAVRGFQKDNDLPVDGVVTPDLLDRLQKTSRSM